MTDHAYVPHPVWNRDQCEYRLHDPNDENIGGICAMPRSAHPEEAHVLRIQLATALSDAAYFKASYARKLEDEKRLLEAAAATVEERDAAQRKVADLQDRLRTCVQLVDAAGLLNLSNGVQLGATSWYVKASDAFDAARAALGNST